jgi:hypothetical protein
MAKAELATRPPAQPKQAAVPTKVAEPKVGEEPIKPQIIVQAPRVHEVHAAQAAQKLQIKQATLSEVLSPNSAPEKVVAVAPKKAAVINEVAAPVRKKIEVKITPPIDTARKEKAPAVRLPEVRSNAPNPKKPTTELSVPISDPFEAAPHGDSEPTVEFFDVFDASENVDEPIEPTPFNVVVEELFMDVPTQEPIVQQPYAGYRTSPNTPEAPRSFEAITTVPDEFIDDETSPLSTLSTKANVAEQIQEVLAVLEPEQAVAAVKIMENIAVITKRLRTIEMEPAKMPEAAAIAEAIEELVAELRESLGDKYDDEMFDKLVKTILQPEQKSATRRSHTLKSLEMLQRLGTHELKLDGVGLYGIQAHLRGLQQSPGGHVGQIGKLTIYYSQHKRILQRV